MMESKPIVIVGNGGHARVLIEILLMQQRQILGYTAPTEEHNPYNIVYLGTDEAILQHEPERVELVNAIGSVSTTELREHVFTFFKSKGYRFCTIIHPSAIVSNTAMLGEGVQIMAGTIIQPFVRIGNNTIINTSASIDHDCCIGDHCHIAPGCVLSGNVTVGKGTHIGTGANIIQNIKIGNNVIIGAGSLVLRNVHDDKKVYGSPAKEVSK